MSNVESELVPVRNPRLAALATSAQPAWLWSADGGRLLWANAPGAAVLGATTAAACTSRRFQPGHPIAAQVARLAATLPGLGQERLERLRGLAPDIGRALTCACSRVALADGKVAVLIAAMEPAGPSLTAAERLARLLDGREAALAAFAPDGTLLHANEAAKARLDGATALSSLGVETLAATALETGSARARTRLGAMPVEVAAERLGDPAAPVLVLAFTASPPAAASVQPTAEESEPVGAPEPAAEALSRSTSRPAATKPTDTPTPDTPAAAAPPAPPAPASAASDEASAERRHPLRFVWQMDGDGRFIIGSDEFIELVGPRTMARFGRPWSEIAAELDLDPDQQVARAVATRETWSGVVVAWPVDESTDRLPVELSGLPVFDRDRTFRGYRGFGVCRAIDRINDLVRARREQPAGPQSPAEPGPSHPDDAAAAAMPEPAAAIDAAETVAKPPRAAAGIVAPAPAAANVVPFRPSALAAEPKSPALSPVERSAFRELAQELTARLRASQPAPASAESESALEGESEPTARPAGAAVAERVLLDRIPVGVLVYRHDTLLYANRQFLAASGYDDLGALAAAGGLNALFAEPGSGAPIDQDEVGQNGSSRALSIRTRAGERLPVEGRLFTVPWNDGSALALILSDGEAAPETAARRELESILEVAADGVLMLDGERRIMHANAGAAALLATTAGALAGTPFGDLFAPESERAACAYFDDVASGTEGRRDSLDVAAHAGADRLVPLSLTLRRIDSDRYCAVFRRLAERKQSEDELRKARREAQRAAAAKADFVAKVSHEIRTPLNTMTGFTEVMLAERFGPIGNERYRDYLKDIHAAGTHLAALLNDLLDLSKIETGQFDLTASEINLNEMTQQCVGIMQPQANRARIIIRTALTPGLPLVVADERSLRQIVLNLLGNSIRFTGPGGQVIVSTVLTDNREVVLRVRDTGVGMSEKDIEAALEPFRDAAASASWGSGGSGLGLPLTKALAEANRANFSIKSAPNAGTLVEVALPPNRVVGQ